MRVRVEEALRDEGRRLAMARAGRSEALARHTYEHRARNLIAAADAVRSRPAGAAR